MVKAFSQLIMKTVQGIFKITKIAIVDFLIFWLIGKVAFKVAYVIVGVLAGCFNYSAKAMSNAHWAIRAAVFAFLTLGTMALITTIIM